MHAFHHKQMVYNLWTVLLFFFQCPELSAHVRLHDVADRITTVDLTGPGMDVTPWYDANGNVTQMVQVVETHAGAISFTNRYEYDFDNRLVAVVSPVLVAQYVYDGLGNLLQITEAGTVRRFVRDQADALARPIQELTGSNSLERSYVWANGSMIAQVESGGTVQYAHFNELGHLLALTDGSGNVTDEFSYHPYGRLVARTGTSETRFGYMAASGVMRSGYDLYLARHRAYSGNLMRFLGRDPAGLAGGANLYLYAGGNPVLLIDPSGLCAETCHPGYISSPSVRREQEIASSWGASIGFGGTMSPDMMRSVSLDWALTIPTAAGGLLDDAVRSVIGAVRGGGSVIARGTDIFETGVNVTPRSVANQYQSIGSGGRTFVTEPNAVEAIVGPLQGNRISISTQQARQLENALGLTPNSLESRNIVSIVDNIPGRSPGSPISGNSLFQGGGAGLPGGSSELTIQGNPSSGGQGVRQIILEVGH